MMVTKCDICQKTINDRENYNISEPGRFLQYALCLICGKPIASFMKKNGLLKKADNQK